ncbi:MAG: response regulator, partial [Myxococcota bacterium]|nr:response regulator [Myxococcota bacterium]
MGRSGQWEVRPPTGAPAREAAPGAVLLVDDEPLLLRALERILRGARHRVVATDGSAAAREALEDPDLDVVLLDLFLGGESGVELLEWIKRERPEVEVVVMTGHASVESAVGCMRRGAFDYLEKPLGDVHRVRTTVERAIERRRLVTRNRALEAELEGRDGSPALVGSSPAMRRVLRTVSGLRHNESIVLVTGESGTGKEVVARALHA